VVRLKINTVSIRNFGVLSEIDIDLAGEIGKLAFINALNGYGKTTFQGALRWCLYGIEPKNPDKFVSRIAFENSDITQVSTSIQFSDDENTRWRVKRELRFEKSGGSDFKRIGADTLTVWKQSATTGELTDILPNPETWLRSQFPERLEHFFLFDGEQMEKFFSSDVLKVIENGVREIAGVDYFESLQNRIREIETKKRAKAAKLSGARSENLNGQLQEKILILDDLRQTELEKLEKLETNRDELSKVNELLAESAITEREAERSSELAAAIENARLEAATANQEFQMALFQFGIGMQFEKSHLELRRQVDHARKEDKLPPPFDPERLRTLLDLERCICGCDLSNDKAGRQAIVKLIEKYSASSAVGQRLRESSDQLDKYESSFPVYQDSIRTLNRLHIEKKRLVDALVEDQEKLTARLAANDVAFISNIGRNKQYLQKEQSDLHSDLAQISKQIAEELPKCERLRKQLSDSIEGQAEAESLLREAAFAASLGAAAGQIFAFGLEKVRHELEVSVSNRFNQVVKGRFKTTVSDSYRVETRDQSGKIVPLSAGQAMMQAYIFAIALREVIQLSFPLIVDTPFGRLDGKNRRILGEYLVEMIKVEAGKPNRQIIFLMQDTEYDPYVRQYFASLSPMEFYFAFEKGRELDKSVLGTGIDPEWFENGAWKHWHEGENGKNE